jgi:hypothetical protein
VTIYQELASGGSGGGGGMSAGWMGGLETGVEIQDKTKGHAQHDESWPIIPDPTAPREPTAVPAAPTGAVEHGSSAPLEAAVDCEHEKISNQKYLA